MLARRQRTDKQVLLLHVGAARSQLVGSYAAPVDGTPGAGRNLDAGRRAKGQRIQQCRFAGAAAAHNGEQLAGLCQAGHVLQQMLARRRMMMLVRPFVRLAKVRSGRQRHIVACWRWCCAARAAVTD